MVGLDYFIDQEKDDDDSDNTTTDTSGGDSDSGSNTTDDVRSDNSDNLESDGRVDYNWSEHTMSVDHTAERNICPSCMAPSLPKDEDSRLWDCPNDDCGTIKYGSGWFEQRRYEWGEECDFLYSIDWVEVMESLHSRGIKAKTWRTEDESDEISLFG